MVRELWLIDESLRPNDIEQEAEFEIKSSTRGGRESLEEQPKLAVKIQDLMIWDTKKWFGGADIRLDALVVHGNAVEGNPQSIYSPNTFRFPDIKDKEPAFKGENGVLVFFGQPQYFLDIFILVSRDRQDSQDLASLLSERFNSSEIKDSTVGVESTSVLVPKGHCEASVPSHKSSCDAMSSRVFAHDTSWQPARTRP